MTNCSTVPKVLVIPVNAVPVMWDANIQVAEFVCRSGTKHMLSWGMKTGWIIQYYWMERFVLQLGCMFCLPMIMTVIWSEFCVLMQL